MFVLDAALAHWAAAYVAALGQMTPEERAAYLAAQRDRRGLEILGASVEVRTARNTAREFDLSPEAEARLIDYARQLARDRLQTRARRAGADAHP